MNPNDIRNILDKKPSKGPDNKLAVLLIAAFIVILGIIVNFVAFFALYNYVMPIFGLPKLGFWQSSALFFLIWMFLGPFRLKNK